MLRRKKTNTHTQKPPQNNKIKNKQQTKKNLIGSSALWEVQMPSGTPCVFNLICAKKHSFVF